MLNTIETSGHAIHSAPDRNAYKVATFHSARVKRLRILLPLAAFIVSLIFIAVSVIRAYLPASQIKSNAIADGDPSRYPAGNAFPTWAQLQAQFVSYAGGGQVISVMAIDGSGVQALTSKDVHAIHPNWTPDGRSLLYCT